MPSYLYRQVYPLEANSDPSPKLPDFRKRLMDGNSKSCANGAA